VDRVVGIDRGCLEFPPDAETVNLILAQPCEVVRVHEFNFPLVGFCAPGDEIEECGFPRTVGAYDGAEFADIHIKCELANGLESVE
jgi:hypothetical protein